MSRRCCSSITRTLLVEITWIVIEDLQFLLLGRACAHAHTSPPSHTLSHSHSHSHPLALTHSLSLFLFRSRSRCMHGCSKTYLSLSNTFAAYVETSMSAFQRARNELLDFAPSDLKLLFHLQEVMDFTKETKPPLEDATERPGSTLWKAGLRTKHPVVMVPGIVTTGLELWAGEECASGYFRQRLWGTMSMVQKVMINTRCVFHSCVPFLCVHACACAHVYTCVGRAKQPIHTHTHTQTREDTNAGRRTHSLTHPHTHTHEDMCACITYLFVFRAS